MTWDATAQLLAVKVIGTVESNLTYDSINYNDPITVGIAQWYGVRAAGLLDNIQANNASSWTGVASSLQNDLNAHTSSDEFWNTRYLNKDEGSSIQPVLFNNQSIQNSQLTTDLNGYGTVAQAQGMDINANTQSFIFFCTMYHQGPVYALQVMATAGPNASIDRYLAVCLNHPVLGQYPDRYNTAYNLIIAGDTSGVSQATQTPQTTGGDGGTIGATQPAGNLTYAEMVGDSIAVHYTDGTLSMFYPATPGRYLPQRNGNIGATVPPAPSQTPTAPPSGGTSTGSALVQWAANHANAYAYGQGPGRLQPDTSGYTDCSGFVYWDYLQVTGKNIGTWGGEQIQNGTLVAQGGSTIDTSNMQPGDVVFYEWEGGNPATYDHTALYAGNGQVWSHGGPGNGPILIPITGSYIGVTPVAIMARRYI